MRVFWNLTPRGLAGTYKYFGGKYGLHLQSLKNGGRMKYGVLSAENLFIYLFVVFNDAFSVTRLCSVE
jgi:hypothetical protein